jgi:hypothetical protein
MKFTLVLVCASILASATLAPPAGAELKETTLPKPLLAQVTLNEKSEKVNGTLIRYDDKTLVIRTGKGERNLKWSDLTGGSQYALRAQLIDKKSATDWLEMAELAMRSDLRDQARTAVANAVRLDASAKLKGDAILRGQGPAKATTQAAVAKYEKSTPEQDAKAIQTAQRIAASVSDKMNLKFAELQTPHFIIFTDWDPREHKFLKDNCEKSYALVSKEFDIPVKENVFVGKLPVFMFAKQSDFMTYAQKFDNFPVPRTVAGYFTSHGDGSGHMVMWKPDTSKYPLAEAEQRWAYTLTHEFTHAFVSRYRTNRNIPRWLNEGLAEVIAYGQFPRPDAHAYAKFMAGKDFDFTALFDDEKMPGGEMYPVMQTMVEALIKENKKAFLSMFDDIKDGMNPEEALKKHYKAGYKDWENAWRRYAKSL